MRFTPRHETYEIDDFDGNKFPIHYDKRKFPNGFYQMDLVYGRFNGKVLRIDLHGNDNSGKERIMTIMEHLSNVEKLLEFIEIKEDERSGLAQEEASHQK